MPYADPAKRADYNRERWRRYGRIYRANRTSELPPVSRWQVLAEDIAQASALAELEGARGGVGGRKRTRAALDDWIQSERQWIRKTSTRFVIGGRLDADQD